MDITKYQLADGKILLTVLVDNGESVELNAYREEEEFSKFIELYENTP